MLALRNAHERDSRIVFDEGPHLYYVDGRTKDWISTTTIIHKLFPQFDADRVISQMLKGKNWPSSKYFGMSRSEIKTLWSSSGSEAASAGTSMHANLEHFYNEEKYEMVSPEFKLFEKFYADHKDLEAFRTEMVIYSEDLKIAGKSVLSYQAYDCR